MNFINAFKRERIDLSRYKRFVALIVAYWGTMAIHGSISIIDGAESGNILFDFVSKFTHTFFSPNFVDILCMIGLYFLVNYVVDSCQYICKNGVIVASLFTILYLVTFSYRDYNDISALFGNKYQVFLSFFLFCGYFAIIYFFYMAICMFFENSNAEVDVKRKNGIRCFISSFVSILLCRLFWILMNYPGSVAGDTTGQLGQWFKKQFDSHHPPLSTFLFGGMIDIGEAFIDRNFGFFLYLLFQAIIGSLIMAYCIWVIYKMGVSIHFCSLTWAFFALTPEFGAYAQWLQKDMIYSLIALLYTTLIVKLVLKKNIVIPGEEELTKSISIRECIEIVVAGIFTCLLRKNGVYCVLPTAIALIIYFGKKELKKTVSMTVVTMCIYIFITSFVYHSMGVEDGSLREALVVPMQQTARYIKYYPDEVTSEEWEELKALSVNINLFADVYEPQNADVIKAICNYRFDDLPTYFKCWFRMGLKHPGTYIAAFINGNYGYWAPCNLNNAPQLTDQFDDYMLENGFYHTQDGKQVELLQNLVFTNITFPLLRYLIMPGFYTWIVVICISVLGKNGKKKSIIVFIPAIMTILVCLASPLCNGLRYIMPVCLMVPLLISYTKLAVRYGEN